MSANIKRLIDKHIAGLETLVTEVTRAVRKDLAEELLGKTNGKRTKAVRRVIKPCIAPGCDQLSKGPRYRYLCTKHLKASEKDVSKWRAAAKKART